MIVGVRRAALAAALLVCCQPASAAGPTVGVELDDGTRDEGQLGGIAADAIEIAAPDGATRKVPIARVRTLGRVSPVAGGSAAGVRLTLIDGTTIGGTDFSTSGGSGTLAVAEGRVELPVARVRAVEWLAAAPAARWLDAVPEGATSDLIVVAKGDGFEMVECAITAIGPETVTVVLDEETIPVKRSKVIGARWLRDGQAVAAGRTLVDVAGGTLRADAVAWTPDGLVLDGADPDRRVTLPAAALQRVDYAAGRITPLATLPPEKLDVEPFFGTLADVPGLAGYFAPRPMAVDGQARRPDLLVRPRTVGVWRIPAQARRFRAGLKQVSGTGAAVVIVTVDERRVLEQVVSGGDPLPVDVDLAGGRRLGVTVDFPPGGLPGSVRLVEPVIEQ